ncbi:hypothetical protein AUJ62_01835 [Candidatus Pacearchaeota archaeon CG1_02_32_21]|nr:MAG: hypothetical protein AUJ62_01835 [Candidatus Pacearchaeota archaeon CG1_02_32_21]
MSNGRCFVCKEVYEVLFKVKVSKMVDVYTRKFCSFHCFQKWLKKNKENLSYYTEEPRDGGDYEQKSFEEIERIMGAKQ